MEKSYHLAVLLILASASPRRAELLRAAGFEFEVAPADVDERVNPGDTPAGYVERLAREKAEAGWSGPAQAQPHVEVSARRHDTIVLAADTAVVVDGEILGKPRNDEDAARMLRLLSARTHQVMTGVCVRSRDALLSRVEVSQVEFVRLTDDQIAWYVASGEGNDKAGGYAVQGLASRFIPRIEGSYTNVVGLPVATVFELLNQLRSLVRD